jgi:hypothetical protein
MKSRKRTGVAAHDYFQTFHCGGRRPDAILQYLLLLLQSPDLRG